MKDTIYLLGEKKFKKLEDLIYYYFEEDCPATYYSDTEKLQCREGCRRSFDDLLMLSKYYFPDTTDKELAKTMKKIHEEDNDLFFEWIFCEDTNRPTFTKDDEIIDYDDDFIEDFCNDYYSPYYNTKGDVNYSLKMIYDLANE